MYAKSAIVSVLLVTAAAPVFSAPLPAQDIEMRELEARLSLPAGAIGDLVKSLGKGLLTGGAVTGLLGLLDGASSDSSSTSSRRDLEARAGLASLLQGLLGAGEDTIESVLKKAVIGGVASGVGAEAVNSATGTSKRELEARAGLGSLIDGLIGAGEDTIESVLKKAIIGGVASGVGAEAVNTATGTSSKRAGIPASIVEDGAKAAEKGISSIIGNGLANGVGSAVGGLGIGALLSKLFGNSDSSSTSSKRAFSELSDEDVNSVLELIGSLQTANQKRAITSSIGKGIAGLVAGLAATQGTEGIIDEIKKLLRKDVSYSDLD